MEAKNRVNLGIQLLLLEPNEMLTDELRETTDTRLIPFTHPFFNRKILISAVFKDYNVGNIWGPFFRECVSRKTYTCLEIFVAGSREDAITVKSVRSEIRSCSHWDPMSQTACRGGCSREESGSRWDVDRMWARSEQCPKHRSEMFFADVSVQAERSLVIRSCVTNLILGQHQFNQQYTLLAPSDRADTSPLPVSTVH